jgi:MATE family multidrug resistance protein
LRDELSAQIRLAAPLAALQFGLVLMGAVDTALLGRYSSEALAGSGIGNSLVFGISCVGMGILMGLDTLVPQALGAGEPARARALLRDGMRVAIIVGLPATLLVMASPMVLSLTDVDPAVEREATIYVWARAIGVVPFLLQVALRSYLSAHSVTRPLVIAVVVGNVVNLIAGYYLIFGVPALGIPPMGVIGAALATSAAQILNLVLFAVAVRGLHRDGRAPATAKPEPPYNVGAGDTPVSHALDRETGIRKIFRIGTPVGLQLLAEVGAFALTNVLAAHIHKIQVAAHNVAIMLASFTFSMAVGVGAATSIRVGHAIGRGDTPAARRAGTIGLGLGGVVMSISALVFVAIPGTLAWIFTDDPAVVATAIPLIQVAAIFQLSDGAQAVGAGALRGAGDTRATFIANVVGHYGIGLGISLSLAFGAGLGAVGLWWGLSAGLTVTAIVLIARFRRLTARSITRA